MSIWVIVEWAPRTTNKEADALANGKVDEFNPDVRIHVGPMKLQWHILPDALAMESNLRWMSFTETAQAGGQVASGRPMVVNPLYDDLPLHFPIRTTGLMWRSTGPFRITAVSARRNIKNITDHGGFRAIVSPTWRQPVEYGGSRCVDYALLETRHPPSHTKRYVRTRKHVLLIRAVEIIDLMDSQNTMRCGRV